VSQEQANVLLFDLGDFSFTSLQ